jgi:hypothetical protein
MAETNTPNPQLPGVKTRIPWQNAADGDWAEDLPDIADAPWYFFHLVWSKNSCGFMLVVFQEPPEPFSTVK